MKVGDHVHVGANTIVEAATIGNHVEIGKNCIIVRSIDNLSLSDIFNKSAVQGKFTIIKDCAKIADNTVIPPNTVVPALALFSGSPGALLPTRVDLPSDGQWLGQFVEDLPESTQEMIEAYTKSYYTRFQPLPA